MGLQLAYNNVHFGLYHNLQDHHLTHGYGNYMLFMFFMELTHMFVLHLVEAC
jgi:hypothetical protein